MHRAGLTLRPTSVRTDKSWELLYLPSQCCVRYLSCIPSFWSFRLSLRKGSNPTLTTNAPALCLRPTLETPLTPCPEWTDGQWTLFHVSQKRGTPRVSFPTHDPPYYRAKIIYMKTRRLPVRTGRPLVAQQIDRSRKLLKETTFKQCPLMVGLRKKPPERSGWMARVARRMSAYRRWNPPTNGRSKAACPSPRGWRL